MSRRKDRERFLSRKQQDSTYHGFRGRGTTVAGEPKDLAGVTCSVCHRKRNVPVNTIPDDQDTYICLQCQQASA